MRELIKLFLKNSFIILFLLLEGIALVLIFQNNAFQRSFFMNSARNITGYFSSHFTGYREYFKLQEVNQSVSEENTRLRNEINYLRSLHKELDMTVPDSAEESRYTYHQARVVNNSVNKQYNYITLDAGLRDGMGPDMAVISDQGVAGIIIAVSENYSLVLPVLNRNFKLSAKIRRNNYFGILEWEGKNINQVTLREIPVHAELFIGDDIVTSGYSTIFPEGITVGTISDFQKGAGNFYNITVTLATDFNNLFYVNVIKNLKRTEQISLENQSGI